MNIDISKLQQIVEYKGEQLSYGRYLFNKCLPEDYPLVNKPVGKEVLSNILNDIALTYPPIVTMKTLDAIKNLGFTMTTEFGYTLSIDELYDKDLHEFSKTLVDGDISNNLKKINSNSLILEKIKTKPYFSYIQSGARGSMDQLKQLILSKGYVADVNNKIKPNLIRSSLVSGMSEQEYFDSCWGARKGMMDQAIETGGAGYLSRQLIYSTVSEELGEKIDCNTSEYLELNIVCYNDDGTINQSDSENFAKSIVWRYFLGNDGKLHQITSKNYKQLVGKTIKLRSPIYCKSKYICKTCYGNLHTILHSNQVGIIATQSISERLVQLVLRTFHIGGVVQQEGTGDSNVDIISGISIANKLFHSPGKTATKEITDTPEEFISKLQNAMAKYGSTHLVHYEIITSAMMWTTDDKKWRTIAGRSSIPFKWVSILQIPSKSSWLLGVAFSRLKTKLMEGLTEDRSDVPSAISKLFRF